VKRRASPLPKKKKKNEMRALAHTKKASAEEPNAEKAKANEDYLMECRLSLHKPSKKEQDQKRRDTAAPHVSATARASCE
jgi:hypothetical protein